MTKAIEPFQEAPIDVHQVEAFNAIRNKEVPLYAVKQRPGKSGKKFSYVDHVWVTETLQEGLQNLWSFEVLDWEVFREDVIIKEKKTPMRSVVARVQFTLHILLKNDPAISDQPQQFLHRKITEVGVFEPNPAMSTAFAIASAVSRGLCRAAMRALGLGIQFYKGDDMPIDTATAWTAIKKYATNQGFDWTDEFQEKYLKALENMGITKEANNLVDRWGEAFDLMIELAQLGPQVEEMPGE